MLLLKPGSGCRSGLYFIIPYVLVNNLISNGFDFACQGINSDFLLIPLHTIRDNGRIPIIDTSIKLKIRLQHEKRQTDF